MPSARVIGRQPPNGSLESAGRVVEVEGTWPVTAVIRLTAVSSSEANRVRSRAERASNVAEPPEPA
jgi:hypothetical protein